MIVKNTTTDNYPINKSVQIDVNTIDENDGYVLPGQSLDLSNSLSDTAISESEQVKEGIYSGSLVLVIDGEELTQSESIEIYKTGTGGWASIYEPQVSEANLRAGIAQGFLYVKNCKIG